MTFSTRLDQCRLLGRSGLRVSPMALGTMTFGTAWGWGAEADEARRLFEIYLDHGGNFIDTANTYTDGQSETLLGQFSQGLRDRLVLATKYTVPMQAHDANSGGNHRKSMVRSVEDSLKRLKTDYIDLLYLHAWDFTTPAEEILRAMDDLVRAGKLLYVGISDTPAWQVARMQVMADLRGWSPLIALQVEHSLVERSVERELVPMAEDMGLGLVAWSPLASGLLSGKYDGQDLADSQGDQPGSRRAFARANGALTPRNLAIAKALSEVARAVGHSPAQVALAWVMREGRGAIPLIGARTKAQLEDNLGALSLSLDPEHRAKLDEISRIDLGFPHEFLQRETTRAVMGQMPVPRRFAVE